MIEINQVSGFNKQEETVNQEFGGNWTVILKTFVNRVLFKPLTKFKAVWQNVEFLRGLCE
jgi:hypothetical protein